MWGGDCRVGGAGRQLREDIPQPAGMDIACKMVPVIGPFPPWGRLNWRPPCFVRPRTRNAVAAVSVGLLREACRPWGLTRPRSSADPHSLAWPWPGPQCVQFPHAQAAQRHARQEAAPWSKPGWAGSNRRVPFRFGTFRYVGGKVGNLMPPLRASSIRRIRSDAFSPSVAVLGFTPAASYMR